ncbi:MAG: lectin-like protein [Planctomycetota bacterium]
MRFSSLTFAGTALLLAVAAPSQTYCAVPSRWATSAGGNGHYYQAWSAPGGITWNQAQAFAQSLNGHLATITSPGENAFVYGVATGPNTGGLWWGGPPGGTGGPWLGGSDAAGSWAWVTGEPFVYTAWSVGEPTNSCGGQEENFLQFGCPGLQGPLPVWNDIPDGGCGVSNAPRGFLVEYPELIHDNGPFVTNATGGAGGAGLSELQNTAPMSLNFYGAGAQAAVPNTLADDFTVCGTWTITHVEVFSYATGNPTTPSPVTGVYVQFYGGNPAAGGVPLPGSPGALLTPTFVANEWTGVYRATTTAPTGTTRAIMRTALALPTPLTLGPGQYWFAFRVAGSTFVPPVTILDQRITGNAIQQLGTGGAWVPLNNDATGFMPAATGVPFRLFGSRTSGMGSIVLDPLVAPCSTASLTVTGMPTPGGLIRSTLSGVTGFGFVGYGFTAVAVPFCVCTIGHEWLLANFTSADTLMIPAGPAMCGIGLRVQGLDFFSAGGCPAPPLALTGTWQVTIQ